MGQLADQCIACFILLIPSVAAGLGVQQLPPTASALVGGSITLRCTSHSHNWTGGQVTWARGSTEAILLDAAHPFYQGRLAETQGDRQGQAEATVTLSELMERDSDLYFCYITSPQGDQAKGTGTRLTVLSRAVLEQCEPCQDAGPLFHRPIITLSLVVLFSVGIILSLQP